MEGIFEHGPPRPKIEIELVGEALYEKLKAKFFKENITAGYTANGDPRKRYHQIFTSV
jgi:hypothetical protein